LTSITSSTVGNTLENSNKNFNFSVNHSSNQSILPSDQSLRQYSGVSTNSNNLNLNTVNSTNLPSYSKGLSAAYNTSRAG
jgi:hypothetical protein